jgi:hypothetical protein
MSQKTLNELLEANNKAGWIEKKREGLGCGIKKLEASWNRNVERYKFLYKIPNAKKQRETIIRRATAFPKGSKFRHTRVWTEKNKQKPKSNLRKVSYQSTNALNPKEQTRLALESMKDSKGGKRRKTRKRKRRKKTKRRRNRRKSKKNKRKSKRRR